MYAIRSYYAWNNIPWLVGLLLIGVGAYNCFSDSITERWKQGITYGFNFLVALIVAVILAKAWKPMGPEHVWYNVFFVILAVGGLLLPMLIFIRSYNFV